MTKEEYREYQKEYRLKNRDKIKEYRRQYHKQHYIPVWKTKNGFPPVNDGEIWKDIEGTDGWYKASNQGRIWSYKKGRLLSPKPRKHNYVYVVIDGKQLLLHRVIAQTFIPNPNGYNEIDHIDTNPLNNSIENLRWVESHRENMNNPMTIEKFMVVNKHTVKPKYEGIPVEQYDLNGNYIGYFKSIKDASIAVDRSVTSISRCLKEKTKTAGGYIWKFSDRAEKKITIIAIKNDIS